MRFSHCFLVHQSNWEFNFSLQLSHNSQWTGLKITWKWYSPCNHLLLQLSSVLQRVFVVGVCLFCAHFFIGLNLQQNHRNCSFSAFLNTKENVWKWAARRTDVLANCCLLFEQINEQCWKTSVIIIPVDYFAAKYRFEFVMYKRNISWLQQDFSLDSWKTSDGTKPNAD